MRLKYIAMHLDAQALRIFVYDHILSSGRPPTSHHIASRFGLTPQTAIVALRDLKIGKAVLVHPKTGEIWMAGPFAASPTDYKVMGSRAQWWANCAWDMLGIAVLAGERVRIETRCHDCSEPMAFDVDTVTGAPGDALVHFLVPARRWYDDIGFT